MAQPETTPEINYLAKDYAGLRQLLLDHMALWLPGWSEEHPADLTHTLVDLLAYAADYLSYYQDAVATEAYLGTARLRRSVKRHVRLLDYAWHEGCNSRVWVQVEVEGDAAIRLPRGTQLFTKIDGKTADRVIKPNSPDYDLALNKAPAVFETMLDYWLDPKHNEIDFFIPPSQREAWLTKVDLGCALNNPGGKLKLYKGQALIFEEIQNPITGRMADADPLHRHVVRLTSVNEISPTLVQVEWGESDALPFDLCLQAYFGGSRVKTSEAHGNIILADYGRTIKDEELPVLPPTGRYYPHLTHPGLTFSEPFHSYNTGIWSAHEMLSQEPHMAMPCITLCELGLEPLSTKAHPLLELKRRQGKNEVYPIKPWVVRSELISSGMFERDYTVEIEDDGRAYLRFGFLGAGWRPEVVGAPFLATYRVGNGSSGNIGRETIAHIVTDQSGITKVRNPMPAQGGTDPVNTEVARHHAPHAHRSTRPCVTSSDYAEAAERHPQVARAVAQLRWSGSRRVMFVYVQRRGEECPTVDASFRRELADFLESFRLAGMDLEVLGANYVPLNISLSFQAQPGTQTSLVLTALRSVFSDRLLPDGKAGFFHPDNWTFGQPLYQSQVIARAMAVQGVAWVKVYTFSRMGTDRLNDPIQIGPFEIIRLHNDVRDPSQGVIRFC